MGFNGSTTSGVTIRRQTPGHNSTALGTYPFHEKGMPPLWSTM